MNTIYLSQKTGQEKLLLYKPKIQFGNEGYSWKIIANLYHKALSENGIKVIDINRPEIYKTNTARKTLSGEDRIFHMAVKPIHELRALPGAFNIFVCGWEFQEFSSSNFGINPYYNQQNILRSADVIACWTEFTSNNLRKLGFDNVITIPPTMRNIEIKKGKSIPRLKCVSLNNYYSFTRNNLEYLDEKIDHQSLLFVTVLNPFDRRKCFTSMLTGFIDAVSRGADAYLVVKLVIDNVATNVWNIKEIIENVYQSKLISERILFVGENLETENMNDFIGMADFYLCTSSAEGMNLPLITAMQIGVPSISTRCTAMESYLNDDCSIEIKTEPQKMQDGGHYLSEFLEVTHYPPAKDAISDAICRASLLDHKTIVKMGEAAKSRAEIKFGAVNFKNNFLKLVEAAS